jgi:uncharacterized protein
VLESNTKPSFIARLLHAQVSVTPEYLRVHNSTRNTEIGDRIELADSGPRRNKGLLGRTGLETGEGLWIVPCEAVHTFGMKFAIDLIYLDRTHRVVKIRHAVRPSRISGTLRAHSVIELPPGAIDASQTRPGDQLQLDRLAGA